MTDNDLRAGVAQGAGITQSPSPSFVIFLKDEEAVQDKKLRLIVPQLNTFQ